MACIKWVFPSPTPPNIYKGLAIKTPWSGFDTCVAIRKANLLDSPTTKESNEYEALRLDWKPSSGRFTVVGLLASVICSSVTNFNLMV